MTARVVRRAASKAAKPAYTPAMEAKLAGSGLDLADAQALGILPVASAVQLDAQFHPIESLQFNYKDLRGQATGFYRIRYIGQLPGFLGALVKPQRYAQQGNTLNHVYLPSLPGLDWEAIAKDTTQQLLLTEGELKAACSCKLTGIPTLGLGGVTVWQSSRRQVALLPPLPEFTWKQRRVYIIFDSDAATNPQVAQAQAMLASRLLALGADARVATLPHNGTKQGLDDFLVAHGDLGAVLQDSMSSALGEALTQLNDEVVFVADQDVVLQLGRDLRLKRDNFVNGVLANRRLIEFRTNAQGASVKKELSVAQEWLKWPCRRTVERLVYAPGCDRFCGSDYNLWRGWGCQPVAGDLAPWEALMAFLFDGTPAERQWFERWLACPLQKPGTKLYTAAVLWGPETGTGKSLIGYSMGRLYGENFAEIGNAELHMSFNEWAVGKQFIMGDEITGSDRRSEADKLKSLITQQKLRINMKHLPTYEVKDCLNYYFTSNHPDAFFLDDQDRRYFVHRVPHARKERAFYQAYMKWLNHGGAEALFHYLLHLDLGDFEPEAPAPDTQSKLEMVDHGKSDVALFVKQLLQNRERELLRLQAMLGLKTMPELLLNRHLRLLYDPDGQTKVTANGLGRELTRAGVKSLPPLQTKALGKQRFYVLLGDWCHASPESVREYVDLLYKADSSEKKY